MAESPRRRALVAGFAAAVHGVTDLATEVGRVPGDIERDVDGNLVKPYHIVYARPGRPIPEHGTLDRSEMAVVVPLQVTTVGASYDHALEGADVCRAGLLLRDPNGDFHHAIDAGDQASVIDRRTSVLGAPEQSGGGLWEVADVYDLEVNA